MFILEIEIGIMKKYCTVLNRLYNKYGIEVLEARFSLLKETQTKFILLSSTSRPEIGGKLDQAQGKPQLSTYGSKNENYEDTSK